MTRANSIIEYYGLDTPFGAAIYGIAAGAGALKTKQMINRAKSKHGTVGHAMNLKSRELTGKGLRKVADKGSKQVYKLAKYIEKPRIKKQSPSAPLEKSNEDLPQQGNQHNRTGLAKLRNVRSNFNNRVRQIWKSNPEERELRRAHREADRQRRLLHRIERKKIKLQAKHDLKLYKKKLNVERKFYNYTPTLY